MFILEAFYGTFNKIWIVEVKDLMDHTYKWKMLTIRQGIARQASSASMA
jgi:hypothetical protein